MANAQVVYDSFGGAAGSFVGHVADSGQTWASTTGDNMGECYLTASHQIRANSAAQTMYYAGTMSAAQQEAIAVLEVWSTGVTGAAAGIELAYVPGGSGSGNGYLAQYNQTSGKFELYKETSGGYSAIGTPGYYSGSPLPVGIGYLKFNVDLSAHTQNVYYSTDGNTWTLVTSATDSVLSANGALAFHIYGAMTDTTGVMLGLLSATCGTFPNGGFAKVSSIGNTTATLTGTAPTGGTANYTIQYQRAPDSSNSPGTWANIGSAQTGLTSGTAPSAYNDTGLSSATKYWYRQVVTDANSLTSYSAGVQFTTTGSSSLASGTLASGGTNTILSIPLSWGAATGGTSPYSYTVKRSANSGMTSLTTLYSGTATSYSDISAGVSSTWYYQITVTDSVSETATSNVLTVNTPGGIYADNANLVYSGRFAQSGSSEAARAKCITTGSRIECVFSGSETCAIVMDTSLITLGSYPEIVYTLDGYSARAAFTGTGVITCTFPTYDTVITSGYGAHKLTIEAVGIYEGFGGSQGNQDQWNNLTCALNFAGIQLDSGASLLPIAVNPNWIEFLGDSDVASHDVLANTSAHNQTQMASNIYWPRICADALGFRLSAVGYGKQGLANNSSGNGGLASGNVPVATSTFGYVYNGVAYSPSVKPLVVVIEYGTNDNGVTSTSAFQTAYQTFLGTIRTAYPNAVIECLVLPAFNGYASYIAAAISAAGDSRTFIKNYSSGSVISTATGDYQADNLHINVQGAAKLGAKLALDIAADLTSLGIAMQTSTSITPTRRTPRRGR